MIFGRQVILTILSMAGKDILKRQLYFFPEIIFYFIIIGLHTRWYHKQVCVCLQLVFMFTRILSNKLDYYNRRCNVYTCMCDYVGDPISWTG